MLDRASLHVLAQQPEKNDPILNVALAEEGDIAVLCALADCPSVGPEALARIEERIVAEGERVGHVEEPGQDDEPRRARGKPLEPGSGNATELDRRLIVHPRSDDRVRDGVLRRHEQDPLFLLAAAAHPHATAEAVHKVAGWPARSPLHERAWLTLIVYDAVAPMTYEEWGAGDDELLREAAAVLARDPRLLARLARDPSRRVRRAVAGNPLGVAAAPTLRDDPACEVRERAAAPHGASGGAANGARLDLSAPSFVTAVEDMLAGGHVASDVARALRKGPLDAEGAMLAARALDEAHVGVLLDQRPRPVEIERGLAAGIAYRPDLDGPGEKGAALLAQCVRILADQDRTGSLLTGKGRLASWLADGVGGTLHGDLVDTVRALSERALAGDRMVLGRVLDAGHPDLVARVAATALRLGAPIPIALLEVAWRTPAVTDPDIATMASRVAAAAGDASLEHEVDLEPRARPIPLLERVGAALVGRAPLSPRASLALVALEPRRVRYILSALPQWKGVLTGAHVARVLKAHAGALSAAGPSPQKKPAQTAASWTQRKLDEVELAVALAVGDLSPAEAVRRVGAGYAPITQGPALAAGIEARATLEGVAAVEPLIELVARERSRDSAALAAWLLVDGLDRRRSASAIAAGLDAPWTGPAPRPGAAASRSMVPAGLAEALATLERRTPGRLAEASPQTPRGRAALASGIARAYRALGGMAVSESSAPPPA